MDYTLQYYDLVLAAILASIFVGGAVGYATAISEPVAVVVFGALAIAFIAHALFINGPVDEFEDLTAPVE